MYELFVGPPELDAEWDDRGIDGVNRFLKRVWNLVMDSKDADITATKEMIKERHKLVYDVTTRLESFSLNTVISAFMEHNNKLLEIAKKEGESTKRHYLQWQYFCHHSHHTLQKNCGKNWDTQRAYSKPDGQNTMSTP